ncbi:MAG: hypothetical protein ACKO90_00700, partial [Microcystis panniformis]
AQGFFEAQGSVLAQGFFEAQGLAWAMLKVPLLTTESELVKVFADVPATRETVTAKLLRQRPSHNNADGLRMS